MSSSSLADAQEKLAMYQAAAKRVAESAESVSVGDQSYTTSDLRTLEAMVDKYTREVRRWTDHAAGAKTPFTVARWSS